MATAPPAAAEDAATTLQDVAYRHEPYWAPNQSHWIKSLLLFFDGVALLVPDYMRDRPLLTDPRAATPAQPRSARGCARLGGIETPS